MAEIGSESDSPAFYVHLQQVDSLPVQLLLLEHRGQTAHGGLQRRLPVARDSLLNLMQHHQWQEREEGRHPEPRDRKQHAQEASAVGKGAKLDAVQVHGSYKLDLVHVFRQEGLRK